MPSLTSICVHSWSYYLPLFLCAFIYISLAYGTVRTDFYGLFAQITMLFAAYVWIGQHPHRKAEMGWRWAVGAAIVFRFLLVFSEPNLSDDFYRFVWDGRLLMQGISPFAYLPVDFLDGTYTGATVQGLDCELLNQLNSPLYFTIYPPVCQFIFWLSCSLFPDSVYAATCCMKACIFLLECGSIYLIIRLLQIFQLPSSLVVLYALNPLVIVELTGNLHFEAAMICFCLLAVWFLVQSKQNEAKEWLGSAVAMGLAVCSKLIPLIFLPLLLKRLGFWRTFLYGCVVGFLTILCFMPLFTLEIAQNLFSSVGLYFQKFEFNASVYYLLRWLGYQWVGYNMIALVGKILAVTTFVGILFFALLEKIPFRSSHQFWTLPRAMLFVLLIYFMLANIVHPWYVASLVAFCIFTRFRFPILWSFLVLLSYYTYLTNEYIENMWLAVLEYLAVYALLIWELTRKEERVFSL